MSETPALLEILNFADAPLWAGGGRRRYERALARLVDVACSRTNWERYSHDSTANPAASFCIRSVCEIRGDESSDGPDH